MPKNVKKFKFGIDFRNSPIRSISRADNNMPNIFQCLEADVLSLLLRSKKWVQPIMVEKNLSIFDQFFWKIVRVSTDWAKSEGFYLFFRSKSKLCRQRNYSVEIGFCNCRLSLRLESNGVDHRYKSRSYPESGFFMSSFWRVTIKSIRSIMRT